MVTRIFIRPLYCYIISEINKPPKCYNKSISFYYYTVLTVYYLDYTQIHDYEGYIPYNVSKIRTFWIVLGQGEAMTPKVVYLAKFHLRFVRIWLLIFGVHTNSWFFGVHPFPIWQKIFEWWILLDHWLSISLYSWCIVIFNWWVIHIWWLIYILYTHTCFFWLQNFQQGRKKVMV